MVDARGNTGTNGVYPGSGHGAVRPAKECECTVLSCTGDACSRGYKRGERGREAPKSLLEEMIEASANTELWRVCAGCVRDEIRYLSEPLRVCPPPPFIDTRRAEYMYGEI